MPTTGPKDNEFFQLKTEVHGMSILLDRLSNNIDKLTEVSSNLSQLTAVQVAKIQQTEKIINFVSETVDNNDKLIHQKVDKMEDEIYREIEKSRGMILQEVKELTAKIEKMNAKMEQMQRWIWIVTGGAMVVGALLSKGISIFFK
jgi:ABC-type transporter Mla subunit MlaD